MFKEFRTAVLCRIILKIVVIETLAQWIPRQNVPVSKCPLSHLEVPRYDLAEFVHCSKITMQEIRFCNWVLIFEPSVVQIRTFIVYGTKTERYELRSNESSGMDHFSYPPPDRTISKASELKYELYFLVLFFYKI